MTDSTTDSGPPRDPASERDDIAASDRPEGGESGDSRQEPGFRERPDDDPAGVPEASEHDDSTTAETSEPGAPTDSRTPDLDRVAQAYARHAGTADPAAGAPSDPASEAPAAPSAYPAPDEPSSDPIAEWTELAERDPRSPAEMLAELTEAEARRDEYLEDVRRARAEFENYRKRVMREGSAQRTAGVTEVVTRLLDVLDDFDRTLDAAEHSDDEALRKGVELVYGKLIGALQGLGLRRIDGAGAPFDPTVHEAVQQVPAEGETDEPTVHQVLRPGYQLEDRVVRAAMVVVAQ